jgi:hypothetical protein
MQNVESGSQHPTKRQKTQGDFNSIGETHSEPKCEKSVCSRPTESQFRSLWNTLNDSLTASEGAATFDNHLDIPVLNSSETMGCAQYNSHESSPLVFHSQRLDWRTEAKVNILVVKLHGMDGLSIRQVTEAFPQLLELVEQAAFLHQATVIERRFDCFIVKSIEAVDRMLDLAAYIHHCLQSILAPGLSDLCLRMGIARGSMTLLGCGFGANFTSCSALYVRDDAVNLAERMATASTADAVLVHDSALWRCTTTARWIAETITVDNGISGGDRGAVFDLSARRFRPRPPCGRAAALAMRGRRASIA